MGGGDLNTKKSWHPSTFKNQERVWKAEQADAAEKRKLAELQHEINEERNREELKTIAKKSGLIPDDGDGDRKLEWMYKGPTVNREEYLLGRTVDKNFEMLDAQEKAAAAAGSSSSVGISQPKNHVEHECIPFSIRQYKGLEGTEQVDMARKLMEDPLMAIKQKEVETRQKILENPVKLKELHRLLKSDQSIRGRDRDRDRKGGKKKDKKDKKKKSKKKRKGSDSSDDSDDGSDGQDLDKLLAEKYKKVQNSMEKQEEVSLDKLLSMKYQKLSKELNKMAKPKKSKKKKDRRRSRSSEDSESGSDSDDKEPVRRRRDDSRERQRPGPSRPRERSRSADRRDRHRRNRSRSPDDRHRRETNRKRSRSRDRKSPKPSREPAPRGRRTPVPSSSSSSESSPERTQRRKNDSDEDDRRPKAKNFGLVSASGKKLELNKRDEVRLYKREEIKAHQSSQKPSWSRPERKAPLTEEEMEAKRKAMMSNAEWRDKERQKNVKRYDDEDRKQDERDGQKKYDKDFIMKQFKHAANNETVEKRIKSNRNNIQRSGGSMNDNFARR